MSKQEKLKQIPKQDNPKGNVLVVGNSGVGKSTLILLRQLKISRLLDFFISSQHWMIKV